MRYLFLNISFSTIKNSVSIDPLFIAPKTLGEIYKRAEKNSVYFYGNPVFFLTPGKIP